MSNNTKDKILQAALEIFSEEGYAGANLKDIAESVGVVKSAFYRHYSSKEELLNAVVEYMENYYKEHFGSAENLPPIPKSTDEFKTLALRMVDFTIHDKNIIMTRKLLLTEQFHDERIKELATEHFISDIKAIYKNIFEKMTENGILVNEDPDMLAFAFTSPIMTLIHYCDRDPSKEAKILNEIEAFTEHFIKTYKTDKS